MLFDVVSFDETGGYGVVVGGIDCGHGGGIGKDYVPGSFFGGVEVGFVRGGVVRGDVHVRRWEDGGARRSLRGLL